MVSCHYDFHLAGLNAKRRQIQAIKKGPCELCGLEKKLICTVEKRRLCYKRGELLQH